MYTMKDVCAMTGLPYETLRFYCNEGLLPNVRRDKNNYRIFSERDLNWLQGLLCLKRCGMSLKDMKRYMAFCLKGQESIPTRSMSLRARTCCACRRKSCCGRCRRFRNASILSTINRRFTTAF